MRRQLLNVARGLVAWVVVFSTAVAGLAAGFNLHAGALTVGAVLVLAAFGVGYMVWHDVNVARFWWWSRQTDRRLSRRRKRLARGLCPGCGYDLTGNLSGVCPECGEARASRPGE